MVITVTINPAMDRVITIDKFRQNVTNRIQKQFTCVGGKGTHVSINLSLLGMRSIAVGVVMGSTGDDILRELSAFDIDLRFIKLNEGNSRTNYVLVDAEGNSSLISDKGELMKQDTIEKLIRQYTDVISSGDTVVISGDASNQRDSSLLDRLIDIALLHKARFCLDASEELIAAGIRRDRFLIKPTWTNWDSCMERSYPSRRIYCHTQQAMNQVRKLLHPVARRLLCIIWGKAVPGKIRSS